MIIDIIKHEAVSNQWELCDKLNQQGHHVTQATLSRDIKELQITKVATSNGKYIYMIPDSNHLKDSMLLQGEHRASVIEQRGYISLEFSGNIAVIKTRNGYATGLAYDIDMSHSDAILGTIAGADTVFAIIREGTTRDEVRTLLSQFIPSEKIN